MRPAPGVEAVEVERNGETVRVESSLFVVSCGAVNSAALLLRSASDKHPNGLGEFVGARRPPLHGASRDDDAGVPSVSKERHGFPEDRRHQRFLLPRTAHALSARADSIAGPHARRHGADGRTLRCLLSCYDWWVARGVDWLAMSEDLPDARNRVIVDSHGRIQLLYRPNNVRAHRCW